jgi:hypothetical protein
MSSDDDAFASECQFELLRLQEDSSSRQEEGVVLLEVRMEQSSWLFREEEPSRIRKTSHHEGCGPFGAVLAVVFAAAVLAAVLVVAAALEVVVARMAQI